MEFKRTIIKENKIFFVEYSFLLHLSFNQWKYGYEYMARIYSNWMLHIQTLYTPLKYPYIQTLILTEEFPEIILGTVILLNFCKQGRLGIWRELL